MLRQRYLFDSPFASMQRELAERNDLLQSALGGAMFNASRAAEAAVTAIAVRQSNALAGFDQALRATEAAATLRQSSALAGLRERLSYTLPAISLPQTSALAGLNLETLASRLPQMDLGTSPFFEAQTRWIDTLAEQLERTSLRALSLDVASRFPSEDLLARIESAVGIALQDFPDFWAETEADLSDVAIAIAEGVVTAAADREAARGRSSFLHFVLEVLSHFGLVHPEKPIQPGVVVTVILLMLTSAVGAGAAGGLIADIPSRRREAAAAAEQKAAAEAEEALLRSVGAEVAELRETVANPPREAHVSRRAWLRSGPGQDSRKLLRLDPGTYLVVYDRRDGWIRVEAEPTPGTVHAGWVYGGLTRYGAPPATLQGL